MIEGEIGFWGGGRCRVEGFYILYISLGFLSIFVLCGFGGDEGRERRFYLFVFIFDFEERSF